MITRRSILFGLIAAPVVVRAGLCMPVHVDVPWIIGDGIHDDAPGLRAFFAGERYRASKALSATLFRSGNIASVSHGRFHLGSTLFMNRGSILNWSHLSYDAAVDTAIRIVPESSNIPLAT